MGGIHEEMENNIMTPLPLKIEFIVVVHMCPTQTHTKRVIIQLVGLCITDCVRVPFIVHTFVAKNQLIT